jgi:transcriptional regulator with XRE-family HTH domain
MDGMSQPGLAHEVGQMLRTIRELRGLSQARLAQRAGTSQQWLSQVERGAVNPTLSDLERFFGALRLRLRFEAVPAQAAAVEDPELALDLSDDDRFAMVSGYGYLLRKLTDVPLLVGGRLAALAHGMPVQVRRLDLIVAHADRPRLTEGMRRFSAVGWSERWQEFRDLIPADRPGPMRWLVGSKWELRVALVDELPPKVSARIGDLDLAVPPLPWLSSYDADVADLAARLRAVGWGDGRP